jgi:hypothetical protein
MSVTSRFFLPSSNGGSVAHQLAARAGDADGVGLVEVLRLLLKRAEQIRARNEPGGNAGRQQAETGVSLMEDLCKPLCLKLFLACTFTALAEQLKSQLRHHNALREVKRVQFSADGDIDGIDLNEPEPLASSNLHS